MASEKLWARQAKLLLLSRLDEKIEILFRQCRYEEAAANAEKALKLTRDIYGPNHIYTITCRNNLTELRNACISGGSAAGRPGRGQSNYEFSGAGANEDRPARSMLCAGKKKTALKLAVAVLIMLFVSAGYTGGFIGLTPEDSQPVYASAADDVMTSLPYYRVNARFSPGDRMVEGEEEVTFISPEPVKEVFFNLYLNRYRDEALNSSEIRKYALTKAQDQGYIDIQWVSRGEEMIPFSQEGELLRVSLNQELFSRGQHSLKIGFRIKIPYIADRVGGNDKGIWLGNWLPTLSVDGGGHSATEVGDPFVNLSSTYEVSFNIPAEYTLVLSNTHQLTEEDGSKTYFGVLDRVRDLPVFLHRGYKESVVLEGDTEIRYFYTSSGSKAEEVLQAARKAVAFFRKNVGEYPWKELNIVENDMYLNGMEYSTMLLISKKALNGNSLTETVFHEVGHQWFYNIIGSDQYNAPFIDEGLVEFLTSYGLKNYRPNYLKDLNGLNKGLEEFESWHDYRNVHYGNGRKLFENLYLILGKNEFENFIHEYYDRYKFGLVTADEFRILLEGKIGPRSARKLLDQ